MGAGGFPVLLRAVAQRIAYHARSPSPGVRLPNTGMAITIDVGDPKDVHGPNKSPIGQRLARLALVQTYGRAGESSGPLFQSATVAGGSVRVAFTHTGGGLVANDGGPLKHFTIAGEDKSSSRPRPASRATW